MKPNYQIKLTGFVISLVLVAMFGTVFGIFSTGIEENYFEGENVNDSFSKYGDYTKQLVNSTGDIRSGIEIEQKQGVLDVIGGYFSAGYSALRTAFTSFNLFNSMLDDASGDVEPLAIFKSYIFMIVLIMLFIGVGVAVMVKMRV